MKPYYSADGIELYQGDNREVLPALLAAGVYRVEDVALLWGDPPYGIALEPFRGNGAAVAGDDERFDPRPWLSYPRLVLWGANHYGRGLPDASCWWVWSKQNGVSKTQADAELAWTSLDGPVRLFSHTWDGFRRDSERDVVRIHPTQKPVALARWGFERAKLKPGDLVLSPWLGSGPEAVAARDMGLRFIGVELDRGADGKPLGYLDACVARLRQRPLLTAAPAREPEQADLLGTLRRASPSAP